MKTQEQICHLDTLLFSELVKKIINIDIVIQVYGYVFVKGLHVVCMVACIFKYVDLKKRIYKCQVTCRCQYAKEFESFLEGCVAWACSEMQTRVFAL